MKRDLSYELWMDLQIAYVDSIILFMKFFKFVVSKIMAGFISSLI